MPELPKDLLKMASGLKSPSGHCGQLCIVILCLNAVEGEMMVQCTQVSWPDSLPCVWVWLTTGARRWRASPARPCCRSWPPRDQYRKYFPANKPRIQAAVGSKNFIIWLYQQYQHPHTLQMSRDRTINIITCY